MEQRRAQLERTLRAFGSGELSANAAAWAIVGYPSMTTGIRPELKIFSRRPFPRLKLPEERSPQRSRAAIDLGDSRSMQALDETTREISLDGEAPPQRITDGLPPLKPETQPINRPQVSERTRKEVEDLVLLLDRAKAFDQLKHDGLFYACARAAEHVEGIEQHDAPSLAHALRMIHEDDQYFEAPAKQRDARLKLVPVLRRAAESLLHAHETGLVHRHIRPSAIGVLPDGTATLGGFGAALLAVRTGDTITSTESSMMVEAAEAAGQTTALPLSGRARHVSPYMAPERARGELLTFDERTDVYGLGAVLYEIVCGHPPYEFSVATLTLRQILHEEPPSLEEREPDLPNALYSLVAAAMRKDQPSRLPSVKAFGRRLSSVAQMLSPTAEVLAAKRKDTLSTWLALGAAVVLVVLFIVIISLL